MMVKRIILLLSIGSLFLASCVEGAMPSPNPTLDPKPTAVIETRLDRRRAPRHLRHGLADDKRQVLRSHLRRQ